MKELKFICNQDQYNELSALAWKIADNAYMKERYKADEIEIELEQNRKTLGLIFSALDKLNVPFWVQNSVIAWADNWRNYKTQYMKTELEKKGIFLQ